MWKIPLSLLSGSLGEETSGAIDRGVRLLGQPVYG